MVALKKKFSKYNFVCYIIIAHVVNPLGENMETIELEEVNSTNSYAKENLKDLTDRTVIHAKKQTAGRGRLNRSWVDVGSNNLYLSIVLKPSNTFNEIYPNITQYLSVSLCKVLETYGLKPQIKWPNDVLINGKKIAGILSETIMQGQNFKGLIVGIGVNLNAKQEVINAIPNKIATALNLETNKNIDCNKFKKELLDEFFKNYDQFLKEGFKLIKEEYINRNCFLNKELQVQVFDRVEKGLAKAINDNGELILLQENNKELVLTIGDIL